MPSDLLCAGDQVTASTGEQGQLVLLNSDGITGYVRVKTTQGWVVMRMPLENLDKSEQADERTENC